MALCADVLAAAYTSFVGWRTPERFERQRKLARVKSDRRSYARGGQGRDRNFNRFLLMELRC